MRAVRSEGARRSMEMDSQHRVLMIWARFRNLSLLMRGSCRVLRIWKEYPIIKLRVRLLTRQQQIILMAMRQKQRKMT